MVLDKTLIGETVLGEIVLRETILGELGGHLHQNTNRFIEIYYGD